MIQKISTQIPKYEILEEIHATSYPAYINTEIKSGYNISIEAKYKNNNTFESGTYRRIFSTDAEWNDKRTISVNYNNSNLEVKFIGETKSYMTSILYDTLSEHTVYLSSEYFKYDGNIELAQYKSVYTSSYDIIIAQSFYKSSLDQGYYNYYYVKIWDNDTLVRDYVPVKRLSDNKYGLYDYVNDTFYSSVGTAEFTGTSKAEPEYIYDNQAQTLYVNDIIINNTHINRIYNKGEIYWGNEYTSTPQPSERYIPALYCMNNNSSSTNQADHATFTLPWAPDPSIAHSIDVELEPITQASNFYDWSLFFGGNTSVMQHMGNIYGFYSRFTTRICADALNSSMETSAYDINNYLNMLWKIQISNAAEVGGQRNCAAIVKAGNNTLISASSVSTRSNWGTFDPYFIFGSQIQHSTSSFGAWQFKLYKFDIYDDNVLVYQLRPYYDTVNQEYGMYDLVNNIFYPSMNVTHPFTGELPQS